MRNIYLIRHGAIEKPTRDRCYLGQLDLPLNDIGLVQAAELRQNLMSSKPTAIFCSDLQRCVKTAAIIATPHKLQPRPIKALREIDLGQWDGLSFAQVKVRYPEEFEARGRDIVSYRPPGGESFMDCALRVVPAFYEILHATRGNIILIGHAGVNRILLSHILAAPLADLLQIKQDYACVNEITQTADGFIVRKLNGKATELIGREFSAQ